LESLETGLCLSYIRLSDHIQLTTWIFSKQSRCLLESFSQALFNNNLSACHSNLWLATALSKACKLNDYSVSCFLPKSTHPSSTLQDRLTESTNIDLLLFKCDASAVLKFIRNISIHPLPQKLFPVVRRCLVSPLSSRKGMLAWLQTTVPYPSYPLLPNYRRG